MGARVSIAMPRENPLVRVVTLVRYRFFLYAGLLPYLLGAAWACAAACMCSDIFEPRAIR